METVTVVLSIVVLVLLGLEIQRTYKRINDMEKRIQDLEIANRQRLPYRSFEELLNAMVALDKEMENRKFEMSLLDNVHGHIANAMKVGTKREKEK